VGALKGRIKVRREMRYLQALAAAQVGEKRLELDLTYVRTKAVFAWLWSYEGMEAWSGVAKRSIPDEILLLQSLKMAVEENALCKSYIFYMEREYRLELEELLELETYTGRLGHYLDFLKPMYVAGDIILRTKTAPRGQGRAKWLLLKNLATGEGRVSYRHVPLAGEEVAEWFRDWARRTGRTLCYTDGSFQSEGGARDFGIGGWAWYVNPEKWGNGKEVGAGSSNTMELKAANEAIKAVGEAGMVLVTDSATVAESIRGRRKSLAERQLYDRAQEAGVEVVLIKGHKDMLWHNKVDKLARDARRATE
jgi:ribonuclease HI